MIWLTWRQLRAPLLAALALVAAACVWLAVTGPELARRVQAAPNVYDALRDGDRLLFNGGIVVLAVAPALLGIFWGAPLVARELETGSYRLAWSQSVTRGRWLAIKLGLTVLAVLVVVGALALAVSWWAHPIDGAVGSQRGELPSRMTPVAFGMRGVVPVGYAVFALALGTFVGLVVRRSVVAMAVTLAAYAVVQVAVPLWVRPHLVPPTTTTVTISEARLDSILSDGTGPFEVTLTAGSPGAWVLTNQTVDADGRAVAPPPWFADCLPPPPGPSGGGTMRIEPAPGTLTACFERLTGEGYRQRLGYHPLGHFWPLQWAETGLYLGLSALCTGLSFWWLRRRIC